MRALFFSASIFFLVGAIGNVRGDCKDIATSGVGVDVGWKSQPTCKKIRNQYPKLCENKNTVKYNCAKSCGTCGFNPQTDCVDTKGEYRFVCLTPWYDPAVLLMPFLFFFYCPQESLPLDLGRDAVTTQQRNLKCATGQNFNSTVPICAMPVEGEGEEAICL